MRRSIQIAVAVLVVAIAAAPAAGQEGALPPWPAAVDRFVAALERDDAPAAQGHIVKGGTIRSFRGDPAMNLSPVFEAVAGGTVVFVRVYEQAPRSLAADLSAAVAQSSVIPAEAQQWLIPPDEQSIRSANITAEQWVVESLRLREETAVAVVAVWRPARPGMLQSAGGGEMVFLLLRGHITEEAVQIDQIVFGVPVSQGRR